MRAEIERQLDTAIGVQRSDAYYAVLEILTDCDFAKSENHYSVLALRAVLAVHRPDKIDVLGQLSSLQQRRAQRFRRDLWSRTIDSKPSPYTSMLERIHGKIDCETTIERLDDARERVRRLELLCR